MGKRPGHRMLVDPVGCFRMVDWVRRDWGCVVDRTFALRLQWACCMMTGKAGGKKGALGTPSSCQPLLTAIGSTDL